MSNKIKFLKSKKFFIILIIGLVVFSGVTFVGIKVMQKMNKVITCMVQFESSGGTKINIQEVEKGMQIIEPEPPTKEGFTFVEWQLNGETFDFNSLVTENIILTAKWEVNPDTVICIVTFDSDGGSKINSIEVTQGNSITSPVKPKRDGYVFKGWFYNEEEFSFDNKIYEDITLKARWEKETSEIKDKTTEKVINNVKDNEAKENTEQANQENVELNKGEVSNNTQEQNKNENSNNNQEQNKNENNSSGEKEKVFPTGMTFSNNNVRLHYDETTTIYYTLTSWQTDCDIINDKLTFMNGTTTQDLGKHKFTIQDGKIIVTTSRKYVNTSGYSSSCEVYIYGTQNPDCYLGKLQYNFIEYPIEYLTLSTENVTLKAPVLTEDGKIPYNSDRKVVEFEYGFPNQVHESWDVWSSDESVAIVTDIQSYANCFEILPYRAGKAVITVRVANSSNAIEKQIYVTVTE